MLQSIKNVKHTITYLLSVPQNKTCRELVQYSINDEYDRIYHYHIRKTGGKSLLFMFMANECDNFYDRYEELYRRSDHRIIINNKVFVEWHPILLQQGNYYFGTSHIPYHAIKLPERTFTITTLRDPVERVIAHYEMLKNIKNVKYQRRGIKGEIRKMKGNFENFINSLSKQKILNQLYMFSESYSVSEAVDNILKCNHIFFLESFDDGIKKLENALNIKLDTMHADEIDLNIKIKQTTLEQLKEVLMPEYEMLAQIKQSISN